MSNDKFVKAGRDMWLDLFEALMTVAQASGAKTPEEMAAIWAGYLAAAAGSGCGVFGKDNMAVIIRTILLSVEGFEPPKPDLRIVPSGPTGVDLNKEQN